jgi:hypothetical protein
MACSVTPGAGLEVDDEVMLLALPSHPASSKAMHAASIAGPKFFLVIFVFVILVFVIFAVILFFNPGLGSSLPWARIDAPEISCMRLTRFSLYCCDSFGSVDAPGRVAAVLFSSAAPVRICCLIQSKPVPPAMALLNAAASS